MCLAAPKAWVPLGLNAVITYQIVRVERLRPSEYRAVVLLGCTGDPEVDAAVVFSLLDEKRKRELRDRFDTWIENAQHHKQWFHGFDHPPYRDCFVFKWSKKTSGTAYMDSCLIHNRSADPGFGFAY